MNGNFTSLVFFTVLSQTAVGALIFREMVLLSGGIESTSFGSGKISLIVIIVLLLFSLSIAFLHLGNPLHAYHAINNLGKSWLSREIFSFSLLIATLIVYVFITSRYNLEKTEIFFSLLSVLLGISLIFSMIKLYMIPAVFSWNNWATPVSFILTTLLSGITLLAVLDLQNGNKFTSFALILITVLIIFSIINSTFNSGIFQLQLTSLFAIKIGLSILSLLIVFFLFFRPQSNKTLSLWVILFLVILFLEIINRYTFFLSFDKSGL